MENLIVLENGLINVYDYQEQNEKVINGRELHEFIESKRQYSDWIKRKSKQFNFTREWL